MTEFEEQKKENDDDDGNDEALKFSACNNDLNMKLRRHSVEKPKIYCHLKNIPCNQFTLMSYL